MLSDVKSALAGLPLPVKVAIGGLLLVLVYVAVKSRRQDAATSDVQNAYGAALGGSSPVPNPMYQGQQTIGGTGVPGDLAGYYEAQLNAQARANELAQSAAAAAQDLEISGLRAKSNLAREDADFQFNLSKRVSDAQADDLRRRGLISADLASYDRQAQQRDSILAQVQDFNYLFGTGDTSATNSIPNVSQQLAAMSSGPVTRTVQKKAITVFGKVVVPARTVEEPIPGSSAAMTTYDSVAGAGTSRFDIMMRANQATFNQGLRQQIAVNDASLDYQKRVADANKPKQKKFLGIIGGDVGSFLSSAAEVAAPVLTGGALRYNSYAPGSPVSYTPAVAFGSGASSAPRTGYPGGTPGINPAGSSDYLQRLLQGLGPARQGAPQLPSGAPAPSAPSIPPTPQYALPSYSYA